MENNDTQYEVKLMQPKDQVAFTCNRCSACCRDLEDKLALEPPDLFYLARCLRERNCGVEGIEDAYAKFVHPFMLEDYYPVFLMNTQGEDHACVFLQNGSCSVYEARPRTCRIYPFSVDLGQNGRRFDFFQCVDRYGAHFTGHKVKVSDWMYQNFLRESREFFELEAAALFELGTLLKELGPDRQKDVLFQLLFYRYFNYNLDEPFMPQYKANQKALMEVLRHKLGKEA